MFWIRGTWSWTGSLEDGEAGAPFASPNWITKPGCAEDITSNSLALFFVSNSSSSGSIISSMAHFKCSYEILGVSISAPLVFCGPPFAIFSISSLFSCIDVEYPFSILLLEMIWWRSYAHSTTCKRHISPNNFSTSWVACLVFTINGPTILGNLKR